MPSVPASANRVATEDVAWFTSSMLETLHGVVLVLATLGMGLFAGLFFGVVVAMMPGLGRADAHVFVTGMQEINAAILNRWFFLVFLGGPLLTGVAMVLTVVVGAGPTVVALVVVAFALSVSALVTTVTVNVPLNNGSRPQARWTGSATRPWCGSASSARGCGGTSSAR